MNDINTLFFIGRLTRDGELTYTQSGTAKLSLSLAVNRSVKQNNEWVQEVSYIDVNVWDKTAENISQYAVKGKQLGVIGAIRQNRWQDKDGKNHSRLEVVVDHVQLLGGKENAPANNTPAMYTTPEPAGDEAPDEIVF